jgi:carboxyl-terminal processing protease
MEVREADLDKHLSNDQEGSSKTETKPKEEKAKDDKSKDTKPATDKPHGKSKLEPGEIVSKNDYQFNQALTLLKGLSLLQSRKD